MSELAYWNQMYANARDQSVLSSPAAVYRPRMFIDGNQWCALYGDNLQDGVAGFGDSPAEAAHDFNRSWNAKFKGGTI